MPKLDGTHLTDRLQSRLDQLLQGEEVASRDLRVVLTAEQQVAMDAAWEVQQQLRKKRRARSKEEESALGWKTKREVHIEALTAALQDAKDSEVDEWQRRQVAAEVRQARIYFDELGRQLEAGVEVQAAKTRANNELTRSGLRRLDGLASESAGLTRRDKEIREMEEAILKDAESTLDQAELEQLDLLRQHEKAVAEKVRKKAG